MQPADSVPCRGFAVAAVVMAAAGALHVAPLAAIVPSVPPATLVESIDDHWLLANRLAVVIAQRRWHEIDEAATAIAHTSPHAPWVPAALGLAIDQLDAISLTFARSGNCLELAVFRTQIERDWPRGAGEMRQVPCTFSIERSIAGDAFWEPSELLRVHPNAPH